MFIKQFITIYKCFIILTFLNLSLNLLRLFLQKSHKFSVKISLIKIEHCIILCMCILCECVCASAHSLTQTFRGQKRTQGVLLSHSTACVLDTGSHEPGAFFVEANSGFHHTCQVHASCPAFPRHHESKSGGHACAASALINQGDGSLKYF